MHDHHHHLISSIILVGEWNCLQDGVAPGCRQSWAISLLTLKLRSSFLFFFFFPLCVFACEFLRMLWNKVAGDEVAIEWVAFSSLSLSLSLSHTHTHTHTRIPQDAAKVPHFSWIWCEFRLMMLPKFKDAGLSFSLSLSLSCHHLQPFNLIHFGVWHLCL